VSLVWRDHLGEFMQGGLGSKAPDRIIMSTRPHDRCAGRTSEPKSTTGKFVIEDKWWHHRGVMPLESGTIRATDSDGPTRTRSWSGSATGSGSIVSALPLATTGPAGKLP
jgi:hypothetical protein